MLRNAAANEILSLALSAVGEIMLYLMTCRCQKFSQAEEYAALALF